MRELQWAAALHIKIGHDIEKGELSTTIYLKKRKIMVVLCVLGFVLFGAILWDLCGMGVVGFPTSDDKILKFLEEIKNNKPQDNYDGYFGKSISDMYKTKIIDKTMIYTFGKPHMSKKLRGVSFKWYVDGLGVVPIWYKSHSEIEKLYNELKNK